MGRPGLKYIQQIIKDQECNSYVQMKKKTDNREERRIVANQPTDYYRERLIIYIVWYIKQCLTILVLIKK